MLLHLSGFPHLYHSCQTLSNLLLDPGDLAVADVCCKDVAKLSASVVVELDQVVQTVSCKDGISVLQSPQRQRGKCCRELQRFLDLGKRESVLTWRWRKLIRRPEDSHGVQGMSLLLLLDR